MIYRVLVFAVDLRKATFRVSVQSPDGISISSGIPEPATGSSGIVLKQRSEECYTGFIGSGTRESWRMLM